MQSPELSRMLRLRVAVSASSLLGGRGELLRAQAHVHLALERHAPLLEAAADRARGDGERRRHQQADEAKTH
jgi:hypothetical protein